MMKPKRRMMKIALERVERTDLICIFCGSFRCEWAITSPRPSKRSASGEEEVFEPQAAIHQACIALMHAKGTRTKKGKQVDSPFIGNYEVDPR